MSDTSVSRAAGPPHRGHGDEEPGRPRHGSDRRRSVDPPELRVVFAEDTQYHRLSVVEDGTTRYLRFDNSFHVFRIEWTAERIDWFVDGTRFFAVRKDEVPGPWVFDHPFFILLNLAVGGNFVGAPNEFTPFPAELVVDWVRVYERAE